MTWITEKDSTYWIPDILPENTEEYNAIQREKVYFTLENLERVHPKWHYDNGAFVDDEYLFLNEGWKLVIDEVVRVDPDELKKVVRNSFENWEEIDEKTLKVTYTIEDFTDEEVENYKNAKWRRLREIRDSLLFESDIWIVRYYENNNQISQEIKEYRQELRDFPETIIDIISFNLDNVLLWPEKPVIGE